MSIGTVADLIHSHSQSNQNSLHFQSSFALQLKCVGDVARGMLFLHSQDPLVIHRDLKPQNLLVDRYWNTKLSDFGMSRVKKLTITVNQVGTPQYCAPEVLLGEKCRSIKNRFPVAINIFGS